MRRPNVRIIGKEESKHFYIKGPVNIFIKSIEENLPNLKKVMPINIQESLQNSKIDWTRKEIAPIM